MAKKPKKKVDADRAVQACRLLISAYKQGERDGGSIEWSNVDVAYEVACEALGVKA